MRRGLPIAAPCVTLGASFHASGFPTLSDIPAIAFVTEGFFGHLSYLLLIISSLMRRMFWLRIFIMGSAVAGIIFDGLVIGNLVGAFWQVLLLAVNVVQLTLLWMRDHRAKFSDEEQALIDRWFKGGNPGARRLLLDLGRWESLEPGDALTKEGKRPQFLTYLSEGQASVTHGGAEVAQVAPAHFIGEMSMMGDGLASADVVTAAPSRVWRIEREKLDHLKDSNPALYGMVEAAIALNLREKVLHGNRATAQAAAKAKEA